MRLMTCKDVLLLNFGGPETTADVETFLRNLFSDTFGIRFGTPAFFQRFLAKKISKKRAPSVAEKYLEIGGGSPLVPTTKALVNHLSLELPQLNFHIAMRYTPPYTEDVILDLYRQGVKDLLLLPLYPHFSYATTGSSFYAISQTLRELEITPSKMRFRSICCFYENDSYIEAQAEMVRRGLAQIPDNLDPVLLFSAHGIPEKYVDQGDPYQHQIQTSVDLILKKLNWKGHYQLAYQSRVGPQKWLDPDVEEVLESYKDTKKALLVIPISFVSDHIETLHELDIEYKEIAEEFNIEHYYRAPVFNEDAVFIACLKKLIEEELSKSSCNWRGCYAAMSALSAK